MSFWTFFLKPFLASKTRFWSAACWRTTNERVKSFHRNGSLWWTQQKMVGMQERLCWFSTPSVLGYCTTESITERAKERVLRRVLWREYYTTKLRQKTRASDRFPSFEKAKRQCQSRNSELKRDKEDQKMIITDHKKQLLVNWDSAIRGFPPVARRHSLPKSQSIRRAASQHKL